MFRARIHAIASGYEDAGDLDALRTDSAIKLACGRLPETDADLRSQLRCIAENASGRKVAIGLGYELGDQWLRPTRLRRGP